MVLVLETYSSARPTSKTLKWNMITDLIVFLKFIESIGKGGKKSLVPLTSQKMIDSDETVIQEKRIRLSKAKYSLILVFL